jgi:predicted phage terminase large subunit-like protein
MKLAPPTQEPERIARKVGREAGQFAKRKALLRATVLENPYIPVIPFFNQAVLLTSPQTEILYGGSAGGGKSEGLLMGGLQYVSVEGYNALLLRLTIQDLKKAEALLDRAHMWLAPFIDSGDDYEIHYAGSTHTYTFPSGATLSFGYVQHEIDKYHYQGGAWQFCVAEGTPVLMADGSQKPIEQVCIGDLVQTLNGPKKVLKTHDPKIKECVRAEVFDNTLKKVGEQIQSRNHAILTSLGWLSYSDACNLFDTSESIESRSPRILLSRFPPQCRFYGQNSLCPLSQKPPLSQDQRSSDRSSHVVCGASSKDGQNGYEVSDDELRGVQPLQVLFAPVMLHEPRFLSKISDCGCGCAPRQLLSEGSSSDCSSCNYLCGGCAQSRKDNASSEAPLQGDAGLCSRCHYMRDGLEQTPSHSLLYSQRYFHPYTKELRWASETVFLGSCVLSPVGKFKTYDLMIDDVSHYITSVRLVNKNCGFDELTQFTQSKYTYLQSRLRKLVSSPVPLRSWTASNPGGEGHTWVREYFILTKQRDRLFIPSRFWDNPHLDQIGYVKSLMRLSPVERAQLMLGNWDVVLEGDMFKEEWFDIIDKKDVPGGGRVVRYWDLAATAVTKESPDPDWTVGTKMTMVNGIYYILDMKYMRGSPGDVDQFLADVAEADGYEVEIWEEQDPGQAGKSLIHSHSIGPFLGYAHFPGMTKGRDKVVRAMPMSSAAQGRRVKLVAGPWNRFFLDLVKAFPQIGVHDDPVDSADGALNVLSEGMDESIDYSQITVEDHMGGSFKDRELPQERDEFRDEMNQFYD